jgi:hypothetical protein
MRRLEIKARVFRRRQQEQSPRLVAQEQVFRVQTVDFATQGPGLRDRVERGMAVQREPDVKSRQKVAKIVGCCGHDLVITACFRKTAGPSNQGRPGFDAARERQSAKNRKSCCNRPGFAAYTRCRREPVPRMRV